MSYCIINNQPVFLHSSRYKEIREQALKGKNPTQETASIIAGTKEGKEVDKSVYEFLRMQHEKDPVNFHINWAAFDITGDEAVQEVWDLLYDYCNYYGYGYLSDLRNFAQQLTDEPVGDSHKYPMGQVFALNHFVKPVRWWWKYTRKMNGRTVSVIIVAKNVYRLVGDLTNFTVYAKEFRMNCGVSFGIYPLLQKKSQSNT
jgi:hypothetical protein